MYNGMQIYRAVVTAASSTTGSLYVSIPSALGTTTSIAVSTIGRAAVSGVWTVPDVGDQVLVAVEDDKFSNVFLLYPVEPPVTPTFTYKVGDTGPGGGIIFFVDRFDEYADFTYLEVAPVSTQVTRTWATGATNQSATVSGADSKALGAGHQNTLDIVAQTGNIAATCAAAYCANLTSGGQSDWYLGSIAEMRMVYDIVSLQLGGGGFSTIYYWSSSEYDVSNALYQDFTNGDQGFDYKANTFYVRPVRRF
jgi:hypothetical protein